MFTFQNQCVLAFPLLGLLPEHLSHGWAMTSQNTVLKRPTPRAKGKAGASKFSEEAGGVACGGQLGGGSWMWLPL